MSTNFISMPSNQFKLSDGSRIANSGKLYVGKSNTDPTVVNNQLPIKGIKSDGSSVQVSQPISLNSVGLPIDDEGEVLSLSVDSHYSIVIMDYYGKVQTSISSVEISDADSFVALRSLPVLYEGQVVNLLGWSSGSKQGGGRFIGRRGSAVDNRGTIAAGSGYYWERETGQEVTPEMFGAVGDGVTDDRVAIQKAIDFCNANYISGSNTRIVTFSQTYLVSLDPAAPGVTGENATGRVAINLLSGVTLQGNGKIVLLGTTGGTTSGGIISNYSGPCNDVVIKGITVDGNSTVVTGTGITCIKLFDGNNILIDGVNAINSTSGGIYLRHVNNDTYGCQNARIVNCLVKNALYIGIQLQRPDTITVANNIIINCTDNAIDVEGNITTSTGSGYSRKVIINGNNIDICLCGVFLESCGNAVVSNNFISNFSSQAIIQNRINTGSFDVSIVGNTLIGKDTYSTSGITWKNNVGRCRVANNRIANVKYAFRSIKGTNIDIGVNELINIQVGVLYVSNDASGFVYSRLAEQWVDGSQSSGVPYSYPGKDYPGNNSTRLYRTKLTEAYFSQNGGNGELNQVYRTGTLQSNSGWGANGGFSLYGSVVSGETVVAITSSLSTVGNYILIGTKYYLMTANASSYTVVRQWDSTTGTFIAGNFTADLNTALEYSMYRSTWSEV